MKRRATSPWRSLLGSCAVFLGCGAVLGAVGSSARAADAVNAEADEASSIASLAPLRSITPSQHREIQRQRAAQLSWGRDPFMRSTTANQINGLNLSGILWNAATPLAIINGQTLRVGEECDGYRVVDITPSYVAVTDDTQTFQLQIAP